VDFLLHLNPFLNHILRLGSGRLIEKEKLDLISNAVAFNTVSPWHNTNIYPAQHMHWVMADPMIKYECCV